jgi:hypothetical protein
MSGLLQTGALDPEAIQVMTTAHENACREVGILDRAVDPRSEILARMIFEYAQRGERDPLRMSEQALTALRSY